jgi:signal transduction histidine kinase
MHRRSLRFRITLTLFLFVSLSSSLFALATYVVNEYQEEQVLDDTMQEEFEEYERALRQNPQHLPPSSSILHSFLTEPGEVRTLPPQLWGLGLGTHHDIGMNGRNYHVLVREIGGRRLYLSYDITRIEQRENIYTSVLIVGVLVESLLALWAGYLLSRHLIAPVTDLANRVSHLDPVQRSVSLAQEFADSEVGIIANAFDRFLARLDQFIARERAFTEDASHELRTPLAVINTASELLLADTRYSDGLRQPLQRIQRASRQMTRLTRALLFLARESENRAEDAGTCQADSVAAEVVDSYRQLHAGQPVEIRLDTEPMTLPVPPELFEIVLANLLQNALAHTRQGHVRVALQQGRLSVEDTGGGIQPADLPRIFERHYRGADSRGIGRGLDLIKRICDRHGWRIEVASSPGQGTRFSVHLGGPTPPRLTDT